MHLGKIFISLFLLGTISLSGQIAKIQTEEYTAGFEAKKNT